METKLITKWFAVFVMFLLVFTPTATLRVEEEVLLPLKDAFC